MKGVTRVTGLGLLALALLVVLALASVASAKQRTANEQLLNDGSGSSRLAPTSTTVLKDRFDPASLSFATGITDVQFTVGKFRTDVELSDDRPAAARCSATASSGTSTTCSSAASASTARRSTRTAWPRARAATSTCASWSRRSTGTAASSSGTTVRPTRSCSPSHRSSSRSSCSLVAGRSREVQFNGVAPAQQNPNAADDSYWKSVDEMYQADPAYYWAYAAHPDWWSNPNGVAISDGATLRNLAGLVKNLLYREACQLTAAHILAGLVDGRRSRHCRQHRPRP